MRIARICGKCNAFIRGDLPCPTCGVDTALRAGEGVQIGMIDGPTHMATNSPDFKVDPNDRYRRRIVPSKWHYNEHIKRSNGTLEPLA